MVVVILCGVVEAAHGGDGHLCVAVHGGITV